MTPKDIDKRLIRSRRHLNAVTRSQNDHADALLCAEEGVLEHLLGIAPEEKRRKIEALLVQYSEARLSLHKPVNEAQDSK